MSIIKDNTAKVDELVNYINSNLKDNIQSKIVWYQGNPPGGSFPGSWLGRFQGGIGLTPISAANIGSAGTTMKINNLYTSLQSLLFGWSCVRRVRYVYKTGNNTNGGGITYTVRYDNTQYSLLDPSYKTDLFSSTGTGKQSVGSKIVATTMTDLISALYSVWSSLGTIYWEYNTCHSNCHNSCHGSGGCR